jgi:hypothetical protein
MYIAGLIFFFSLTVDDTSTTEKLMNGALQITNTMQQSLFATSFRGRPFPAQSDQMGQHEAEIGH